MDKATQEKIDNKEIIIHSPLEWQFQSSNKDEAHIVDLSKYLGSGECSCPHFQFRIKPKIKTLEYELHTDQSQCKHIKMAKHILVHKMIQHIIDEEN